MEWRRRKLSRRVSLWIVGVRMCVISSPPFRESSITFYTLMRLCNGCMTHGVRCSRIRPCGSLCYWAFISMNDCQYLFRVVARHDDNPILTT